MSVFERSKRNLQNNKKRNQFTLFNEYEQHTVELFNGDSNGAFVIGCEHGSNLIPEKLGTMGLHKNELSRHIAWDIGAAELTKKLSTSLNSPAILQRYSRLVYDCNRCPNHDEAIITDVDGIHIKGNSSLNTEQKIGRELAIYRPFHECLTATIDDRRQRGEDFSFVTIHSFNEKLRGQIRPWQIGFIYNQKPQMSKFLINWFRTYTNYVVGNNEPYSPLNAVDHTLRVQAEVRSIPYTMIEVRNDLLQTERELNQWANLLSSALREYHITRFI